MEDVLHQKRELTKKKTWDLGNRKSTIEEEKKGSPEDGKEKFRKTVVKQE